MTRHLYITKIEAFTSEQPAVEFATYDEAMIKPPTMLDAESRVVPPSMSHEVIRSTGFMRHALDRHGRETVVYASLGLSEEVETALSLYIDSNRQLQEENASLLEEICIEGQRAVCLDEALSVCRNAGVWQRLKWVFTGVRL